MGLTTVAIPLQKSRPGKHEGIGVIFEDMNREDLRRVPQEPPRSIGRVLNVLETVADRRDGLSLSELAQIVDTPKSSLLMMLKGLVASNHLTVLNQRYRLGGAAFKLAHTMLGARPNMSPVLHEALVELWERTQESAVMTSLDREAMTVVYEEGLESPQTIRYTVAVSSVRPLYSTAAGQAMLAFQPTDTLDRYFATTRFEQHTRATITDPARLREKLARIREDGFAVSIQEGIPGAVGIAAPLFGRDGSCDRALLVAGPLGRLDQRMESAAAVLVEICRKTSMMLQYAR